MAHRILLVDDELHILRAAEFKLKRHGYDVMCASDGEDAWARIQVDRPELIVTDLQMPRLNGLELIERLRATPEFADMPVVMLTAKGFELSTDETANKLGILDVIPKPFSPRELCKRVQMALEESERRRQFNATTSG